MTEITGGRISTLSEAECRARLETTTVGLLAFVDDAQGQQLLPVNFAVLEGNLYFMTAPDGVLSHLTSGHPDVAFCVLHQDEFRVGWNVTVRGTATVVDDLATRGMVMAYERLRPWPGGTRPLVIRITPAHISGRRVFAGS